jgi:hypothetical protein
MIEFAGQIHGNGCAEYLCLMAGIDRHSFAAVMAASSCAGKVSALVLSF